jgi:hypothetical protein
MLSYFFILRLGCLHTTSIVEPKMQEGKGGECLVWGIVRQYPDGG